ncbi:MAG: HPr family phosphocarrier protein [Rhodospirillaceae bacterium]|nr:HPr family phosphocarrier protein [Rhodospirillaceae bacterium]
MTNGTAPTTAKRCVTILNKLGLHARAAAKFVKIAEEFRCQISVSKDGETVSGRSIMGLMMLAATPGSIIQLAAHGADATEAVDLIAKLIERKFDED